MKIGLMLLTILITNGAFAGVNFDAPGEPLKPKSQLVLHNFSTGESCVAKSDGLVNSRVRDCDPKEIAFASDLAMHSTNAKTAFIGPLVGYYLVCSAINVGSASLLRNANQPVNVSSYAARSNDSERTVISFLLGGFVGSTVSVLPCLPVSGINYGLFYLYEKSQGRSGSFSSAIGAD